jgi:hypothetical protein
MNIHNIIIKDDNPWSECLECIICNNIALEPVLCHTCDQLFCKNCIIPCLQNKPNCPHCSSTFNLNTVKARRFIQGLIEKLPSQCGNEGCNFEESYTAVLKHLPVCEHEIIRCPNSELCIATLKRKDLEAHYATCPYHKSKERADTEQLLSAKDEQIRVLSERIKLLEHDNECLKQISVNRGPLIPSTKACTCQNGRYPTGSFRCDGCRISFLHQSKSLHICPGKCQICFDLMF